MSATTRTGTADPAAVKYDFVRDIDGVEVRLPSLSYLRPGLIRRIRKLGDVDALYTLLELVLPSDALAAVDDMNPDDYRLFLDAWRAHSGVNLGES
ncbi:hypothetical protein [Nocardia bovistercoris]|uniref:Phage tail assembly protein n=1 Tax=Nocardia bovistercoris TaxID=2785916 RepID=A0A931N2K5_9NOCA|nr:hypothetical protein [Nocardia bovistercoris]MBH0777004.1 hypothetical protein [Nocardia bovistercoris]